MALIGALSPFDLAAGAAFLISGLLGFVRGATRELTTVIAFVVAALAAIFGLRFTAPIAVHLVHPAWLADTAAVLVSFVAVYIVLRTLGGTLTRGVRQTALSGLDRILGFAIGLVRALVVLGAFVLLLEAATPPARMPAWITHAHLFPIAGAAADGLKAVAPKGMGAAHDILPAVTEAVESAAPPLAEPHRPSHRGYTEEQRRAMDDLVEKSR